MTEDQDNAGEVVAGAVRVALTVAGQLAEQAARRREADLREAERDFADRAATLQSQLAAERELALRSVRDVVQGGDAATVDEVVRAWEQARGWDDVVMAAERVELEGRIRERFGVDPRDLSGKTMLDQAAAGALVACDIEMSVTDTDRQEAQISRSVLAQAELAAADGEASRAWELAAKSHPAPAALATNGILGASAKVSRRRPRSRQPVLQPPGR